MEPARNLAFTSMLPALLCQLLLVQPSGAAESLSIVDPVSPPAESIKELFILVLAITGGIFIAVEGMLIYCVIRFRERPGVPPETPSRTAEPPQLYGSKPIELAWTVAPVLIVFVLFLVVARTVAEVRIDQNRPPPGTDPLRITVVGHQWWWEYRYAAGAGEVVTANEMHVPVNRLIYLDLKSADVIHSFWVPRLAGKTDVIPGRTNQMWFQAQQPGTFLGQCAEYCGAQHANMKLVVIAEPREEFQRWLDNEGKQAAETPEAKSGRTTFLSLACVNCHTIRGTRARGTFGPDLTHLGSRRTLASCIVSNDHQNLMTWVADPGRIKSGCSMPSMHLTKHEVEEVVAYLETLK